MARLSGVEAGGPALVRLLYRFVRRELGRVPRPLRVLGLRPRLLYGQAAMEMAHKEPAELEPALLQLARVRAAMRIGCPF